MPFAIVRDDITHVKADAIVNAANEQLRRGGGVCGAIFEAAGARRLQAACDKIGHCDTGSAVATPAYALPARYVIHAVGPIWRDGTHGERELLASCYRSSLELAASFKCRSIAFPLISAGIYGYPHREALEVAQGEIRSFLDTHEMEVTLVLFDKRVMQLADGLRLRVERYIDDVYADEHGIRRRRPWELQQLSMTQAMQEAQPSEADLTCASEAAPVPAGRTSTCPNCGMHVNDGATFCPFCGTDLRAASNGADATGAFYLPSAPAAPEAMPAPPPSYSASAAPMGMPITGSADAAERRLLKLPGSLRNLLTHLDAGFSETLLTMIDERGLKDAQVYKRANLSRQHFSKIRSNPRYKPTKQTVLALAVALELSLEETNLLLERAGFALSHADRRDVIVEFFIREGIYDVFQINDALFAFDQPLLG